MFVGVARLSLQIPGSGSLKAKRQVLRRVTDRVKARFNAAVAEVEDQNVWQKATIAIAVVGNDRAHVNEQLEKVIRFVEEMYVAPLLTREMEILSFGDQLFGEGGGGAGGLPEAQMHLPIDRGERSLAEAEGMGSWTERPGQGQKGHRSPKTHEEARARARALRNPREWEKG